jgi:hypothetical protein
MKTVVLYIRTSWFEPYKAWYKNGKRVQIQTINLPKYGELYYVLIEEFRVKRSELGLNKLDRK